MKYRVETKVFFYDTDGHWLETCCGSELVDAVDQRGAILRARDAALKTARTAHPEHAEHQAEPTAAFPVELKVLPA